MPAVLGLMFVLMIFPFRFAADEHAPVGGSCSFFFVFMKHRRRIRNSSATNTTVKLQLSRLLGGVQHWSGSRPYWLFRLSPSTDCGKSGQDSVLRQWRYQLWFQASSFIFFFFKCENEDGPLIILLIFGLGKAALGLQRLTNQPLRIHQTRSFAFHECKCNKTLSPEKGRGKRRCVSIRWFQTHRLTVLSS